MTRVLDKINAHWWKLWCLLMAASISTAITGSMIAACVSFMLILILVAPIAIAMFETLRRK